MKLKAAYIKQSEPIYQIALAALRLDEHTMLELRQRGWQLWAQEYEVPSSHNRKFELRNYDIVSSGYVSATRFYMATYREIQNAKFVDADDRKLWCGDGADTLKMQLENIDAMFDPRGNVFRNPKIVITPKCDIKQGASFTHRECADNMGATPFTNKMGFATGGVVGIKHLNLKIENDKIVVDTGDALRKDDGKPRFDLLPPEPLFALAELYAFGAKKYQDRGWEAGMSWGRCFGALMRHAWKWARGEEYDDESGAHHMIAVAWNAIAIYTYFVRKIGKDDRAKLQGGL